MWCIKPQAPGSRTTHNSLSPCGAPAPDWRTVVRVARPPAWWFLCTRHHYTRNRIRAMTPPGPPETFASRLAHDTGIWLIITASLFILLGIWAIIEPVF